jgi:hypothetical protein
MSRPANPPATTDMCLMLRAYGEQRWLLCEVAPLVTQLEQHEHTVAEEQLAAALEYLEALWIDAHHLAAQTDGAFEQLEPAGDSLQDAARRYRTAVRRQRAVIGARVEQLLTAGRRSARWPRLSAGEQTS